MPKLMQAVNPPSLPKPAGFAHGFEVQGGKTVYMAGQVAMDKDGQVVGKGDLVAQFRQALLVHRDLAGHVEGLAALDFEAVGETGRLRETRRIDGQHELGHGFPLSRE